MHIQCFLRSRGPEFHVLQVSFDPRVENGQAVQYRIMRIWGKVPKPVVVEDLFHGESVWFGSLMSFASQEREVLNGKERKETFTKEEAKEVLRKWRMRKNTEGFTKEREFLDGELQDPTRPKDGKKANV